MSPIQRVLAGILLACSIASCGSSAGARAVDPQPFAARALAARTFTNPVIDHDFPDPGALKASDGYFYSYATQTSGPAGMVNIQAARSRDLAHWETLGDALPVKPSWAKTTQNFWAPHVLEASPGHYVMYFAAAPDNAQGMAIGVATGSSAAGPFVDSGALLVQSPGFQAIDPMAFQDPKTGKKFLYWGSGFQPIKVQPLTDDWLHFQPGSAPQAVVSPSKRPHENLVEGVWVHPHGGFYYLFYSGDDCCGDKPFYAVMVARAKSPLGPFVKLADATGKPSSVILDRNDRWLGPGHNAVLTDARGQDWILYHAIDARNRRIDPNDPKSPVRRPLLVDRIGYRDGWPVIGNGTPTITPQRGPALE